MAAFKISFLKNHTPVFLAVVFAVALQIQMTLFASADYLGIRVNLADLLLPAAGVFILGSLVLKKSAWPQWKTPFGYWAIALLSAIVLLSCVNGYRVTEEWSQWAALNKCAGWFILMAYLGAGAWAARNATTSVKQVFIYVFIAFFCVAAIYSLIIHYLFWTLDSELITDPKVYIEGFMYNRNAFGFLVLAVCVLSIPGFATTAEQTIKRKAVMWFVWFLIGCCILVIGSRALYIALIPIFAVLVFQHRSYFMKYALPGLALGAFAVPLLFPNFMYRVTMPFYQTAILFEKSEDMPVYSSDHLVFKDYDIPRLAIAQDALNLIQKHPVTGAGLGTLLHDQQAKHGKNIAVIDNSLLWILTEMGPLGLFGFIWVFIVMLRALYNKDDLDPFSRAVFLLLLVFGVFSIFHEILYTRFLWFILGMALVVPKARQDEPAI